MVHLCLKGDSYDATLGIGASITCKREKRKLLCFHILCKYNQHFHKSFSENSKLKKFWRPILNFGGHFGILPAILEIWLPFWNFGSHSTSSKTTKRVNYLYSSFHNLIRVVYNVNLPV